MKGLDVISAAIVLMGTTLAVAEDRVIREKQFNAGVADWLPEHLLARASTLWP